MADRVLFTDALTVTGSPANNQDIRIGFAFGMNAAATLNGLGRWVVAGNTGTHLLEVGLYTPTSASTGAVTILGSVTVDTNGATAGEFLYANFGSPVALSGGTSYVILSTEVNGGDQWLGATTEPTFAADAGPGELFDVGANFQHCYTLDLSGDVPAGGCTTATAFPGTSYVPVSALWDGPGLGQDLTDVSTASPAAFGADTLALGGAPQTLTDVSLAEASTFGVDLFLLGDVTPGDTLILYSPPGQSPHGTDQCPCDDWPFLNTSAELPDSVVYIANRPWHYPDPPIGRLYTATGCLGLATSTVSQEDADAKALLQAMACLDDPGVTPSMTFGTPPRIDDDPTPTFRDGAKDPPLDGSWVTTNESFGSLNTPGLTEFSLVGRGGTITPTWTNYSTIVSGFGGEQGGGSVWGTRYGLGFEATRSVGPYLEYTRVTLTLGYLIPLPSDARVVLWAGIAEDVTTGSPQVFRIWNSSSAVSNSWRAEWPAGSITVYVPPGETWQVVIGGHATLGKSDFILPGSVTVDLQAQTRLPGGDYPAYEYAPSDLPQDATVTSTGTNLWSSFVANIQPGHANDTQTQVFTIYPGNGNSTVSPFIAGPVTLRATAAWAPFYAAGHVTISAPGFHATLTGPASGSGSTFNEQTFPATVSLLSAGAHSIVLTLSEPSLASADSTNWVFAKTRVVSGNMGLLLGTADLYY